MNAMRAGDALATERHLYTYFDEQCRRTIQLQHAQYADLLPADAVHSGMNTMRYSPLVHSIVCRRLGLL
jgi:hypothetical protein